MKSIFLLVVTGIVAIPLLGAIPMRGADVWYIHWISLFSFSCVGVFLVLWNFHFLYTLLGIYCVYNMVFVAKQYPTSIVMLVQVMFSFLSIYAISKFTKKQRKVILWAIVVAAGIQCFWVILQYFNLDPIFSYTKDMTLDDTVGFVGSHNQIGVFFAVVSPVVMGVCPWLIPFVIFGLWCSTTTSTWIAFLIANGYLLYSMPCKINKRLRRSLLGVIVLIMAVCSLIFFSKFENLSYVAVKERIDLVKNTIRDVNDGEIVLDFVKYKKSIKCNPMLGYGLGNFKRFSPMSQYEFLYQSRQNTHVYAHAHNDYAEAYFDLGIIGWLLILLIIIDLFYKFIIFDKSKELIIYFSCIVAQMVSALGVFTIHTAVSGMLLIISLGLFYGEWRKING